MSNVAVGFDDSTETRQQEKADSLLPAQHDDLSSKKTMEDGLLRAHLGSSKQAMEEGNVDGVHSAQHGHLSSEKILQEGHIDGVQIAQHGDSNNDNVTEEGFDDDLQRAQLDSSSIKKEPQEGYDNGSHRSQHDHLSCEQAMEEGRGDEKAETEINHQYASSTASVLPQPEEATNAQTPHDSHVDANLAEFGTLSEHHNNQCTISHGEPGTQANFVTLGKHHPEYISSAQESGDYVDQNMGSHGRSREQSNAACTASFGTLEEQNEHAYGSPGGHGHENTSACGTSGQHTGGNNFANADFCTEGGVLGRYPHKTMFANGNVGEYTQENACEDPVENCDLRGNAHDFMSTNNESDANAHEKMIAYSERGGGDFKINLSENVTSIQAPSLMISPIKSGSLLSGSSYYTSQFGSMKNIGLALRFGSAIFSLIAFSVIISTNEKRVAAGSTFFVKFSDYQAYNYLAALNLLSFLYSSGQLVLLAQARNSSILSSPVKWGASVYLCDQMLAFLIISSSSSAATASELSRHGLRNIWPPACSTWKLSLFCSKADVAVGMSFISFLFMLLSSFSSGYHLSKLLAE